jgi:hypothetical protein
VITVDSTTAELTAIDYSNVEAPDVAGRYNDDQSDTEFTNNLTISDDTVRNGIEVSIGKGDGFVVADNFVFRFDLSDLSNITKTDSDGIAGATFNLSFDKSSRSSQDYIATNFFAGSVVLRDLTDLNRNIQFANTGDYLNTVNNDITLNGNYIYFAGIEDGGDTYLFSVVEASDVIDRTNNNSLKYISQITLDKNPNTISLEKEFCHVCGDEFISTVDISDQYAVKKTNTNRFRGSNFIDSQMYGDMLIAVDEGTRGMAILI